MVRQALWWVNVGVTIGVGGTADGKPYNDILIFPPNFFSASKNVLSGNRTGDLKIILAFGSGRCGHP